MSRLESTNALSNTLLALTVPVGALLAVGCGAPGAGPTTGSTGEALTQAPAYTRKGSGSSDTPQGSVERSPDDPSGGGYFAAGGDTTQYGNGYGYDGTAAVDAGAGYSQETSWQSTAEYEPIVWYGYVTDSEDV